MCGLFGMMGPGVNQNDLEFMQQLAYVSGLRGQDGTGVVQGTIQKRRGYYTDYAIEKSANSVNYFLWYHKHAKDGNQDILGNVVDNFFIGHVRHATKGKITDENAHPFEVGKKNRYNGYPLVGVHNGTLWDAKYQHDEKTDSELFMEDIERRGPIPVLSELMPSSAYAIVLLNAEEGYIQFARNTKRSLYFGINKVRKVMYWCSEMEMMMFCAQRTNTPISKYFNCSELMLHTLRPEDIQVDAAPKWKKEKITPKEVSPPVVVSRINYGQQSNIVPWVPPNKPKITRESLHVNCTSCNRNMNLLDQYQGMNIDKVWMCLECLEDKTEETPTEEKVMVH